MDILDDLNLIDFPDDFDDGLDFDLDDILFEFSTPGLFSPPKKSEPAVIIPAEEPEPAFAPAPELPMEEAPARDEDVEVWEYIPTDAPTITFAAITEEDVAPAPPARECTAVFTAAPDEPAAAEVDALPAMEEVPAHICPEEAAEDAWEGEADVRVYVHTEETAAPGADLDLLETVPFGAVADLEMPAEAAPISPAAQTPGLFAKLAGAFAGLFGRKKASAPLQPAAPEEAAPADVPFFRLSEEADTAEDILLFMTGSPEEDAAQEELPVYDAAEALPEDIIAPEEVPAEPLPGEVPPEAALPEEDADDVPVYMPGAAAEEEAPVSIEELLFDFSMDDEDDVKVFTPAMNEPEDDVRVYAPGADTRPAGDLDMLETVPFTAVPDLKVPDAPAAKPGLLAMAAGLFAGLFSGKQKPAPRQPETRTYTPAEDPFAGMEALFAAGDASFGDDDVNPALMLELELAAEREAEREANAAAMDAHDQLVHTPAPEFVVPPAVLEVRQEQEAAIRAAEAAASQADEEEEEAPLTAEEEARLFAWLDSLEAPDAAPGSLPAAASDEDNSSAANFSELAAEPEYAPQPEYIPAYTLDAEDAPAALMPQLTIDDEEEAPAVDEAEPVSPEALQESMDMAEQLRRENESPAEAAARRAKEDAELRYVPDEPPAKVIGSRIAGRFGAVFSVFTNADSDPGEDEEALGPEVPPSKAYRYFDKYVNGYRFRLRISVILSIFIGWISLGLPVFGSLNNPAAAAAACLMIQLAVMLAGADILATGVRGLLRRKPGLQSMLLLSSLASVLDAVVIILTKGAGGYLPFCGVSAISMCFAIYGSLLYCRGQRFTFRSLEKAAQPMTIGVDYGIVDEETTTAYRTPGHPEQFIHRSEEEDLSETVYGIMGPALTLIIPALALLAAAVSKSFGDFFHIMAAMFAAACSFGAVVAFPLPYFLVQRDLYAAKAAIAGWAGAKELGRVATMIVTDRDLFPDETVSIDSVRIVDSVPPELTLSYFCSLILKSGSCLVPAFTQLAENNECEILPVEDFKCHEAGGLSGVIGPDEVLVASHSYMKLQGFRIPARKKDSENALFLAVNGHVIAYIMVNYRPLKSVREGLASAISGNVEMVFAARDFNVTPLLISKKFKSPTDTLRFPSYEQRFEITEHGGSDTATCAAVVSRKSFYSYAMVVKKARNLYSSVSWATILSALSGLLGVALMFVMALTGAGAAVTVGRLLMFMLLFAVPTLALCVSITK